MPKARRRKDSEFQTSVTKSVFLYGMPNVEKCSALTEMQNLFTRLVNNDIKLLDKETSVFFQIVKNDKKDPDMRKLEKSMRPAGINSAFCQNAFDIAVTHLSNRLENIRLDMLSDGFGIFAKSKVLFAMSVMEKSRTDMIKAMNGIGKKFHKECALELSAMTNEMFHDIQVQFLDAYATRSLEYKIPELRTVSVPLDSRLMKLERSTNTVMPYVITITNPTGGKRIAVPINTSRHSLHKIDANKMAGAVALQMRGTVLRIGWSYTATRKKPAVDTYIGVDTGITDAFYTSDGRQIGSMNEVIDFYHQEVEPAFAELSDLRNKKRKICHYLRNHELSEDVRRSLIRKVDTLERMMQTMDAPYRKKRHYYEMLDHEIKRAVDTYLDGLNKNTMTVLEKLDIREFNKSKTINGKFSMFARGKLQQKLMETLNWKGYDFMEIVPDFTSQVCPVCGNLDANSRTLKAFKCTCCGHEDDADHNASINIRERANDKEILDVCEKYKYQHKNLQEALRKIYAERCNNYKSSIHMKTAS